MATRKDHLAVLQGMIGRRVSVTIDRPMGSRHPMHPNLVYDINYGFVPETKAPDGDPINAYVVGVGHALGGFEGVVVAVIDRLDDVEGKLVVAPSGEQYTSQEILDVVRFQEQ